MRWIGAQGDEAMLAAPCHDALQVVDTEERAHNGEDVVLGIEEVDDLSQPLAESGLTGTRVPRHGSDHQTTVRDG